MGINGLSESFFFSTVGVNYLKKYRYFIIGNALIYILTTYLLLPYGVLGIIAADITSIVNFLLKQDINISRLSELQIASIISI